MPIQVEIEGKGVVAEFPDGTDPTVIDAAIKRDYFTPQRPTIKQPEQPYTQGLGNIPLGGGDIPAGLDMGQYSQSLNELAQPSAMWDAAKTLGASAVLGPASGVAGLAAMSPISLLTGGGLERANDWVQAIQGLIPQPQTPGGQRWVEAANAPMIPFQAAAPRVGQAIEELGGPWWMQAMGHTLTEAAPAIGTGAMGLKSAGAIGGQALPQQILKVKNTVRETMERAIRPSKEKTRNARMTREYYDDSFDAAKAIASDKDKIPLIDKEGGNKPTGSLPETADEFEQAIYQAKRNVWNKAMSMSDNATQQGALIPRQILIDELRTMANDPMTLSTPRGMALSEYFNRVANQWEELATRPGRNSWAITPMEAEQIIAEFNAEAKGFFKTQNPNDLSSSLGADRAASILRRELENRVTQFSGPGHAELKQTYGALSKIENDVAGRATVFARQNPKGFFDITDVPLAAEFVKGVVTANPARLIAAAGGKATQIWLKRQNKPNYMIKKMFEQVDELVNGKQPSTWNPGILPFAMINMQQRKAEKEEAAKNFLKPKGK